MNTKEIDYNAYHAGIAASRDRRMEWWRAARFGMFLHWGPYATLGRGEWVRNMERIPRDEYSAIAAAWRTQPHAARAWCRLARQAGMKYAVMTTKHHDGFCLWNSMVSDFNSYRMGPRRDLVAEFVEACRAEGLRVGLYYSLMDWYHPDGATGEFDANARERFQAYTQGLVRELCTNFGKLDILWYDVACPLWGWNKGGWDSLTMNAEVRRRQPNIIINDRAALPEDFTTPERHISAAEPGRDWESCMTSTCSWSWAPMPAQAWTRPREVVEMLRTVTAGGGNLLLNIAPSPQGPLPSEAKQLLQQVGKWISRHKEPIYGHVDRVREMETSSVGDWTARGNIRYLWIRQWPGSSFAVGGLSQKPRRIRLIPGTRSFAFDWHPESGRVVVKGLPSKPPDQTTGWSVLAFEFSGPVIQNLGPLMTPKRAIPSFVPRLRHGPFLKEWKLSKVYPYPEKNSITPRAARLSESHDWRPYTIHSSEGIANVQGQFDQAKGICYLAQNLKVSRAGRWILWLGHDAGIRVFLNGKTVFSEPARGPLRADRSQCIISLTKGVHELCVAMDASIWGFCCCWEAPAKCKTPPLSEFPLPVK